MLSVGLLAAVVVSPAAVPPAPAPPADVAADVAAPSSGPLADVSVHDPDHSHGALPAPAPSDQDGQSWEDEATFGHGLYASLDADGEYDPTADAALVDADDLEPQLITVGHAASTSSSALPSTRRKLVCAGNGTFRTVVVYAHLRGQPDRRATHLSAIRATLERSNQAVAVSARASGGPVADLRVACTSGGAVSVRTLTVTSRDFAQIKRQAAAAGLDSPREKYLIFGDFTSPRAGVAGLADLYLDKRRSLANHNNGTRTMYSVVYGPANFTGTVPLHELLHNLGAVQPGAPGADGSGHCTRTGDLMCTGGGTTRVVDRGNSTYLSTATRSGQWLHHHWNLGWEGNRFVRIQGRPTPNLAPTARLTATCQMATCTFDASASSDPDGRVAAWRIQTGDGTSRTGARTSHTYPVDGTYTVRLTVTDDRGATATVTRTVTVSAPDPTARVSSRCEGRTCTFDASGSTAAGGARIVRYRFELDDGRSSTAAVWGPVTFDTAGRHRGLLTVTDSTGRSATRTVSVLIAPEVADLDLADLDLADVLDPVLGEGGLLDPTLDAVTGDGGLLDPVLGEGGLLGPVVEDTLGDGGLLDPALAPVLDPLVGGGAPLGRVGRLLGR